MAGDAEVAYANVLATQPLKAMEKDEFVPHTEEQESVSDKKGVEQHVLDTELQATKGDDEETDNLPTLEEIHSLRRFPAPVPWRAYGVAVCELAERFSYYGVTNAFTNYIQQPRPPTSLGGRTGANTSTNGVTGALGKGQQAAFAITTFNSFWVYCTPLLGAYLADSYWGRYNTIIIALVVATIGHVILIVSGVPTVMDNTQGAYGCLIVAIIVFGIGSGFFKSNISPLIAEQVTSTKMHTSVLEKTGEKVIIDPSLTTTRLFMYFYLFINIGALVGQIGMSFAESAYYIPPNFVARLCAPSMYFVGLSEPMESTTLEVFSFFGFEVGRLTFSVTRYVLLWFPRLFRFDSVWTLPSCTEYVGFWLEYTLPTAIFLICFPILMFARKHYIRNPPAGSLLPSTLRIFWYCTKPCLSWNPIKTFKAMRADSFWETACPSKIPLEQRPKWMTFDDTWVLETRRAYKACQVFCLLPIYQLAYNQMTSNLLSQAATMELHGTPNQIVQNLDPLAICTCTNYLPLRLTVFSLRSPHHHNFSC